MRKVNFSHPANAQYLKKFLAIKSSTDKFKLEEECDPATVPQVNFKLGMHEAVVDFFWNEITRELPENCAWIVRGRAVLVRPSTGIIFGFKATNVSFALRLPSSIRENALKEIGVEKMQLSNGSICDVGEIGEEWVLFFAKPSKELTQYCLAAYRYAE